MSHVSVHFSKEEFEKLVAYPNEEGGSYDTKYDYNFFPDLMIKMRRQFRKMREENKA